MDTAYSKGVIDLAFEEGRNEGREVDPPESDSADPKSQAWQKLVEGETVTVEEDDLPEFLERD